MTLISDLKQLKEPLKNPVLTIGNFDGMHIGHLALFDKVKERAKKINGQSAVMTFEPHPIKVMLPGNGPPLITPIHQKLRLMGDTGIDVIFCIPFTKKFAATPARKFVKEFIRIIPWPAGCLYQSVRPVPLAIQRFFHSSIAR